MEPGERLRQVREKLKLSQEALGAPMGFKYSKVRDLESGKQKLTLDIANSLEEIFFISSSWLLRGIGEPMLHEHKEQSYAMAAADMVKIPLYSAVAEGGPGAINHHPSVESYLSFTREYARVQFGSSGNSLACLKAAGDSMAPYINAGDVLIVDVSDRQLTKDGAAYVLQIDETTVVKRLHRLSRERISIRSDNPHGWSRDCKIEEMKTEGIDISGRVVAVIKMA